MKVRIGKMVFDAELVPIAVELTETDRSNIANMDPGAEHFVVYPDNMDPKEITKWAEEIGITKPESTREIEIAPMPVYDTDCGHKISFTEYMESKGYKKNGQGIWLDGFKQVPPSEVRKLWSEWEKL